jgi:hypothetical protein
MDLPERWIRVWFQASQSYTEVGWHELEKIREAYKRWHESLGQDNVILECDSTTGGTNVFAISMVESYFLMDQDSWRAGQEWDEALGAIRKAVQRERGEWE